jgi:hypothetical protein
MWCYIWICYVRVGCPHKRCQEAKKALKKVGR